MAQNYKEDIILDLNKLKTQIDRTIEKIKKCDFIEDKLYLDFLQNDVDITKFFINLRKVL